MGRSLIKIRNLISLCDSFTQAFFIYKMTFLWLYFYKRIALYRRLTMQKDPKNFPPRDILFYWQINIRNKSAELDARALIYFCIRNRIRISFRITERKQALFWVTDEETEIILRKCMIELSTESTYHSNPFYERGGDE